MAPIANHDPHIRFPQKLGLRVPRGLPAAVDAIAERRHTSPSEWVRQTLLRALEQEGVQLRDGRVLDSAQGEVAP